MNRRNRKKRFTGQGSGKVSLMDEVKPKNIFETPEGDTVIDFGQNMSALIQVTAAGKKGDVIRLDCFEVLDSKGNVYLDNLRGAKESLQYTFGEDGTMWSADMNSFNHYAYGSIGEWLVRVMAGLEVDEKKPGYKHAVIYPRMGGDLSYVKAEYHSVYGAVKSFWEVTPEETVLHVSVPVNTTATICLDGAKEVKDGDGLHFTAGNGCMQAEAGSGDYEIHFVR